MILKKINIWSMAKIYSILMAIIGLILGLFSGILAVTISVPFPEQGISTPFQFASLGFASIIIFPLIYGIIGLIAGALGALIYNLAARLVGGIELEFDKK